MEIEKIKDQRVTVIKDYPVCRLCILYGSAAENRLTERSDIDVAVAGEEPLEKELLVTLNIELTKVFGREADVLDIHKVDGIILSEIIGKGSVIKKDVVLYAYFMKKVMFFHADMLGNIRYILQARAKRIAGEV